MSFFDFFGKKAPREINKTLKVLDCSSIFDLAGMYSEARERGDDELMKLINDRMGILIKEQGLAVAHGNPPKENS